jgi:hypothetical protein
MNDALSELYIRYHTTFYTGDLWTFKPILDNGLPNRLIPSSEDYRQTDISARCPYPHPSMPVLRHQWAIAAQSL